MTISARSICEEVQRVLLDLEGDRITASTVVRLINKAQRDIQLLRPDTTATIAPWALTTGVKQALPDYAATFIDMPSNATGRMRKITKTDRYALDSVEPNWASRASALEVVHFMHDPRTPRQILVYPPASSGAAVDLEYSAYPVDILEPVAPGKTADTVSGNISLRDEFANALTHMTLHYAYMTDLEGVNNLQLAQAHSTRAGELLGLQLQTAVTTAPKT